MKAITLFLSMIISTSLHAQHNMLDLFVGTYTNSGKSEGIYVYNFNELTADFSLKAKVGGIENPSFLAFNPESNVLYSVSESNQSSVSSFSYVDGKLQLINTLKSGSSGPCHIVTDKDHEFVFVSNYGGGSLSVFQTNKDGSLKELVQEIAYKGNGPNAKRQQTSHVHSATFSPDEKFLLVQDLGTDIINVYPFMPKNSKEPLQISKAIAIHAPAGSGPRHISFSKNGKYVYVAAELTSTVQVYSFNNGNMKLIQEIDMLSNKVEDPVGAADIHLSNDGRFLYTSNRGTANEITIYKVNGKTGKLTDQGRSSVLGIAPRNFTISKNDSFLLVGNQESDEIVIFKRNKNTGDLKDTGKRISVGSPVCLIFN